MGKKSSWGSLREKRPGIWEIRYQIVGDDGRVRRMSETVKGPKRLADDRLAELRTRYNTDAPRKRKTRILTLGEYWDDVYHPEIEATLAPMTVIGYESKYRAHIAPRWQDVFLKDIEYGDIQAWLLEKTPKNSRGILAVMRAILSKAAAAGYMPANPASNRFNMPQAAFDPLNPEGAAGLDIYSPEELNDVFARIHGEHFEATWIISAFGGANKCEALGVWREEIVFDVGEDGGMRAVVPILRDVTSHGRDVFIGKTKRPSRNRNAVIPSPYSDRLKHIIEHMAVYNNSPWLLHEIDGNVYNPEHLSRDWKRWVFGQGGCVRWVPWKNLRPSYATALLNADMEIGEVAKILGHTTPNVTYSNYDRRRIEDNSASIGRALRPSGSISVADRHDADHSENAILKELLNAIPKEELLKLVLERLPQEKLIGLLASAL